MKPAKSNRFVHVCVAAVLAAVSVQCSSNDSVDSARDEAPGAAVQPETVASATAASLRDDLAVAFCKASKLHVIIGTRATGGTSTTGGTGALGTGNTMTSSVPVPVAEITNAVSVSAGIDSHTCAVLGDGRVQCWGPNGYGQLGDGTTTDSLLPVTVIGITNAASVVATDSFNCATLNDGKVQCWGRNAYGQFGNGTTTDSPTPVTVSGF